MKINDEKKLPIIPVDNKIIFPDTIQLLEIQYNDLFDHYQEIFNTQSKCIIMLSKVPFSQLDTDEINLKDFYAVGIKAEIVQIQENQDLKLNILVEGMSRVYMNVLQNENNVIMGHYTELEDQYNENVEAQGNTVHELFKEHMDLVTDIPPETLLAGLESKKPANLADIIGSYLNISIKDKQEIIEELDVEKRLKKIKQYLNEQIIDANLNQKIDVRVENNVEEERKEVLLNAKLRAIRQELNQKDQESEIEEYKIQLQGLDISVDAKEEIYKEILKLERSTQNTLETSIIRSYLDFILGLPWNTRTDKEVNINEVSDTLNKQHYGLNDVKERILEYLAVRKLAQKGISNILCLAGPPGVGKTSIVQSVAMALGRPFQRISLGGICDEADLRGHRRTYVGALPGKIAGALYKARSLDPVILLDEVDKMAVGFRGDPASVLLEILDPEQNHSFIDHYTQIPIDLSEVIFVCTANELNNIPTPLLNRLEIIQISGYSITDKIELAQQYLFPKQLEKHGLSNELECPKNILELIISHYTSDVGLRGLNRAIQRLLRKVALKKIRNENVPKVLSKDNIQELLGVEIPKPNFSQEPSIGRCVALYSIGMVGNILPIEAVMYPGVGSNLATGNIDPILREIILTAVSFIKNNIKYFELEKDILTNKDLHVHFHKVNLLKEGDGWGMAIFTAIFSAILKIKIKATTAFAGQISLLGNVLPTSNIEQKLLAASQLGIDTVFVPSWNMTDPNIFIPSQLKVVSVKTLFELKTHLLNENPI